MGKHFFTVLLALCGIGICFCACTACVAQPPVSGTEPAQSASAQEVPTIQLAPHTNPLTGLAQKENAPQNQRPLAVMVDNVQAALPQRGLSEADLVYEMVTESGITRLMAVYSDYTAMPEVGPVRSARDQHVQLMLPLGALYLHVGGSTYATEMLTRYHYEDKSINGRYESGALALDAARNAYTDIEHCWFSSGALFTQAALDYSLDTQGGVLYPAFDFVSYKQRPRRLEGGEAADAYIRFSSYANSSFLYDAETARYYKFQFGAPHIDENNEKQLSFDNVFVLFTDISKYPDGVLAKVNYAFGGVGFYLSQGRYEKVRWMKGNPENPLRIVTMDGTETNIKVNPGQSYIAVVDLARYDYFKITGSSETAGITTPESVASNDVQEAPDE